MNSERLQAFYKDRSAVGEVVQPTFRITHTNALCGDSIVMTGIVRDGVLLDAKFTAVGCMVSQAAASALMSMVRGKSKDAIAQLVVQDVLDTLGVVLGPNRQQCVALSLNALQKALTSHD